MGWNRLSTFGVAGNRLGSSGTGLQLVAAALVPAAVGAAAGDVVPAAAGAGLASSSPGATSRLSQAGRMRL